MLFASIIILLLIYRTYLYYRKRNDTTALTQSRLMYFNDFYPKHFSYYNYLDEKEKIEFIERSLHIREMLRFESVDDMMITENIKTLVSASFTQITFGFDTYNLENFNTIFLHRSVFYSRLIDRDVKGLTFANGKIHFSWEDFVKGYMFSNDKLNLALHELAHALQIECYENKSFETPEYDAWKAYAEIEIANMKTFPEKTYFRSYAATNIHEFFAVCVECFFEDPIQFRTQIPSLYHATCKVLMQDMAKRMEEKSDTGETIN